MLVEFNVGNYRSFKENVTISMVVANISSRPKSLDEQNIFHAHDNLTLLTSAAVYGANASGKSNLITALRFMRRFVLTSSRETQITEHIDVEPFLLSIEERLNASTFEIVFLIDGVQYRYGFEVTVERVIAEWLYRLGSLREQTLFEREQDSIKANTRHFREGRGLEMMTRPNALFLSVVAQFNGTISTDILKWFQGLSVNTGINDHSDMMLALHHFEESPHREGMEELIRRLDVGIDRINVERTPAMMPSHLPDEVAQQFKQMLDALAEDGSTAESISVKTLHTVFDAKGKPADTVVFDLEEQESAGTKRLFALAYPIMQALSKGTVIVTDELDVRVHPNLALELVRLFNSQETNPHHAQLVFTTHNTNLLSAQLFRRDQIWFVEKSRQGASDLYSLVEYRIDGKVVRNDASFEKDYIAGRYGAIPFTGDLSSLLGVDVE
ncbi:MAG: ATP-binding protein [Chloroflexi bacterium AL-W]|nr:ATP-binding protein [Chloroflexi bacterium AL-N1]NOK64784.1 ATP-binding protein [Chloroflexi bacterium AL-N10]NOK76554.1 ATP-binding protein [Chloroflexi bacterium AL-N5]NOK80216.1 ATP-binding protein [Chloroflexi bacterium AL-W]NOK86729.1 ATP-binding protein [Chloroflexi bacterium AL-N15]